MTKTGAGLTIENCTFYNKLKIYSLHKERNMFYLTENVFSGEVEIFVKHVSDDKVHDSWLILRENQFKNHPRIFIENMGTIIHRNTFKIRNISTVGTIIASHYVNITNNIFETHIDSKFGFHGYLIAEKKMDDVNDVFDLETVETQRKVSIGKNTLVRHYQN